MLCQPVSNLFNKWVQIVALLVGKVHGYVVVESQTPSLSL
jgi:hypothetical protein